MSGQLLCEKCQTPINVGDWPFCPHGTARSGVITDDIPGGVIMYHGVCEDDGTPKKFYSKSEIAKAAKAKGLFNRVEHVTPQGTDKAPHTTRWI